MKETFLTVWKDNEKWFDFPQSNEQSVMDMIMKKNLSHQVVILPMGEEPQEMPFIEIKPTIKKKKNESI